MELCTLCDFSLEDQEKYTCDKCKIVFHFECIMTRATHSPGEIIKISKTQCPNCRTHLKISPIPGEIFEASEISIMNDSDLYKSCKSCLNIFSCGEKSHAETDSKYNILMPDRCSNCEQKIFECPKCHLRLEHIGGCSVLSCCIYGFSCDGPSCDHGKTDLVPFCGHRWEVESSMIVNEYKPLNPIGEIQTEEMCLRAVRKNSFLLQYVHNKTAAICLAAASDKENFDLFYVPEHLRTLELCLIAVNHNKNLQLQFVPDHIKTPELCLTAVTRYEWAIQFVPDHMKSPEICLVAVSQDGNTIQYIPEHLMTYEVCFVSVTQTRGNAIQYIPEHLKTHKICLIAIKNDVKTFKYIPEDLKTPEFYLTAVTENGNVLQYIPKEFKTSENCLAAVKQDGTTLEYVPKYLKTLEICLAAVTQNGIALRCVPKNLKTSELCITAVSENKDASKYVSN